MILGIILILVAGLFVLVGFILAWLAIGAAESARRTKAPLLRDLYVRDAWSTFVGAAVCLVTAGLLTPIAVHLIQGAW